MDFIRRSVTIQQLSLLLWKNSILKLRRPISTLAELLTPLAIVVILMLVRNLQLKFNMHSCFLREKQMDSMGPVPFLRDFFCTINSTCYNETQIQWNDNSTNKFQTFLSNITSVYSTLPAGDIDMAAVLLWIMRNPAEVVKLNYSFNYITEVALPLMQNIQMILSNDHKSASAGLTGLVTTICGSDQNDADLLIRMIFKNYHTRPKRSPASCEVTLRQNLDQHLFLTVAPILFGKILYTPYSDFTFEIIKKANRSFEILDQLRLASIEWRVHFKDWLTREMTNNSKVENWRQMATKCINSSQNQLRKICTVISKSLNLTTITSAIHITTMMFELVESLLNCVDLDKFVPVPSAAHLSNLSPEFMTTIFAGVVFDPAIRYDTQQNATLLKYTIRMPNNRIDSTKNRKVLDMFWTPGPRLNTFQDMKYYTSGFLMLQESLDRAFIELVTNNNVSIGSSIQIMPTPCFVNDKFIKFASQSIPFFLTMAWSPTYSLLVKCVVYEKEMRLKEFMLVMGLSPFVHWLAWFTVAIVTTIIPNLLSTLIMKYWEIFEFSSAGVMFLLIFSYNVSIICQALMLTVFFDNANVAAVCSGLIYFVFYIPFVILIKVQDDLTFLAYFFTGLLSQVSFCNAINFIAFWEQTTEGAQFGNLFQSTVLNLNFGVGHCIVILWINVVIYLLIMWYVEAVFPGQYGIPKKWYFFLTRHYWSCHGGYVSPIHNTEITVKDNNSNSCFENVVKNMEIGISIENLTKRFSVNKFPSVDNLNLKFYKSQITAFLGHNGAGKTTTISILTGIYPPTSGTAYILNQDITTEIRNIRKCLGLCPQHNVLFDHLTVENHIYFYSRLKGMTATDVKLTLGNVVEEVGLTEKIKIQSSHLSGGMKRKLSVALAFVGHSKVIFLDEPTAGVDPFARRGIWDLIIGNRDIEKTIILTTHHMDEADYLSDRIAIISKGKLKCCGSSAFLKNVYGDGYYLILVKSLTKQNHELMSNGHSLIGENVFTFIQKYVDDAQFVEETSTQCTFLLPKNRLKNKGFSIFFQDLDNSLTQLNIASYGLSDTTLEHVFLKIADESETPENNEKLYNTYLTENDILKYFPDRKLSDPVERRSGVDCTLLTGGSLLKQQFWALQIKRFNHSKRDVKGQFSELILPILVVILMLALIKLINPLANEPSMIIHPWLMMPKARGKKLNTFYRREDYDSSLIDDVSQSFRTDLGEAGIRCMNSSLYSLDDYPCYPGTVIAWSGGPKNPIPLNTPSCDCQRTGYQQCSDPLSGGPPNSQRLMASSDVLHNLTGYNISDHLLKKFAFYAQKLYGGYQLLLPSRFGLSCNDLGKLPFWNGLRETIINSTPVNTSPNALLFTKYFQHFFVLSGRRTNFTRIWINTKGYVSMPAYSNIFANLLLRSMMNTSKNRQNYGIVVSSHPFKYSELDLFNRMNRQMLIEVSLSDFVILALSLIPASFVLFLIEERVTGSKRQQFVSGIDALVYWISNFFWDIVKYTISAILVVVVFFIFNYESYISTKNLGAFICILCCYGFSIIPHMYPFSFVFSTPSTAFVILSAYNMFVGSITTMTTFLLDRIQNEEPSLKPVNDVLKKIFLIFPQYCLGRGMTDLSFNYLRYNISNKIMDYHPFDWDISGEKLASFGILFVFWSGVVVLIESGVVSRIISIQQRRCGTKVEEIVTNEDSNVMLERERILSQSKSDDVLRVINLTKMYNPPFSCGCKFCNHFDSEGRKLAVNNVCFGVKIGECFGLLGVNGAGKTTLFKMLTGEETITKGDAMINNVSLKNNMVSAHRNMGFCPQFDALHSLLTCEEELYLYGRIRGIYPSQLRLTVEFSLTSLSLAPHSGKTTRTLSGGNKRKLSTAISLIGSPGVVFMDEPTSGMDAGARRFLWNRIRHLTTERHSVVLTSHNMEECEILCHRLVIMVNGSFQCLGSIQELKSKFGNEYLVTVRMHSNCDATGEREIIKGIISDEFQKEILLKDENFIYLQYKIDLSKHKLGTIFEFFENLKTTQTIVDYSICQTTLDELFINLVKRDDA